MEQKTNERSIIQSIDKNAYYKVLIHGIESKQAFGFFLLNDEHVIYDAVPVSSNIRTGAFIDISIELSKKLAQKSSTQFKELILYEFPHTFCPEDTTSKFTSVTEINPKLADFKHGLISLNGELPTFQLTNEKKLFTPCTDTLTRVKKFIMLYHKNKTIVDVNLALIQPNYEVGDIVSIQVDE